LELSAAAECEKSLTQILWKNSADQRKSMIIRNPTNGSIGIAIHSIIQLTIAKKQPKKFLGWGSVGLVFKKGTIF